MPESKSFLSEAEIESLVRLIQEAELKSSGEIRIHIETNSSKDPLKRAKEIFAKLGMHKTKERNGILFYLAHKSHKFAVFGDKAIDERIPDHFWDSVCEQVLEDFRQGNFAQGLEKAIHRSGEELIKHFPRSRDDANELSNEISFGQI